MEFMTSCETQELKELDPVPNRANNETGIFLAFPVWISTQEQHKHNFLPVCEYRTLKDNKNQGIVCSKADQLNPGLT